MADFALGLVPDSKEGSREDPYWRENSKRLIVAIIESFAHAAYKENQERADWTLLDIVNAFETPETLKALIKEHNPSAKSILSQVFEAPSDNTSGSIYSSLATHMLAITDTAIAWHDAILNRGRRFSLREFVRDGSGKVLLLPNTEQNEAVLKPLNEVVIRALRKLLIDNRVNKHTRETPQTTQIFIDELQSAGRFEDLIALAAEGRSFGVELNLGFQSIPKLKKMYGAEDAAALLEMCAFRGYLRAKDETAKWVEDAIGQALIGMRKTSFTLRGITLPLGLKKQNLPKW